jgi:hypothetical protein
MSYRKLYRVAWNITVQIGSDMDVQFLKYEILNSHTSYATKPLANKMPSFFRQYPLLKNPRELPHIHK